MLTIQTDGLCTAKKVNNKEERCEQCVVTLNVGGHQHRDTHLTILIIVVFRDNLSSLPYTPADRFLTDQDSYRSSALHAGSALCYNSESVFWITIDPS